MSSTLSSARSRFSAGATKPSVDASLVSADQNVSGDQKKERFSIKRLLLDRRILLVVVLPFTFCIGVTAALVWQSSKRPIASNPQAVLAPAGSSSNLEHQLEPMLSGLAAVRQNLAELANGLVQVRHDIADVQTAQQALFDKMSEPPPRPAVAPTAKPTPRPSQAPPVR
jgi:septal ring factor EnvC (AmiA/AmiB activator)